jgi:hypothetical protein
MVGKTGGICRVLHSISFAPASRERRCTSRRMFGGTGWWEKLLGIGHIRFLIIIIAVFTDPKLGFTPPFFGFQLHFNSEDNQTAKTIDFLANRATIDYTVFTEIFGYHIILLLKELLIINQLLILLLPKK